MFSCVEEIPIEELESEVFSDSTSNTPLPQAPPEPNIAPEIISLSPHGTQPALTTFVTLQVSVDINSDCRFDTENKSYESMSEIFKTTNYKVHSHKLDVVNDKNYLFHVQCQSRNSDFQKSNKKEIKFYVNKKGMVDSVSPTIVSSSPNGEIDSADSLNIVLSESGICKFSDDVSSDYESMATFGTDNGINHYYDLKNIAIEYDKDYLFYVLCKDIAGNSSAKGEILFKLRKPNIADLEKSAREILQVRCFNCHGGSAIYKDLDVTSDSSLFNPVNKFIIKGKPEESRLYHSLTASNGTDQMPPSGTLVDSERDIIKRWIASLSPDPDNGDDGNEVACLPDEDLNSASSRMLLNKEIERSFDVLFGGTKYEPDLTALPGKIGNKFGIIKDGSLQTLSHKDVRSIFDSFEKVIDLFITDANHSIFTCSGRSGDNLNNCLSANLVPMIYRAWRRPLTTTQKQEIYSRFSNNNFNESLKDQLLMIFLSPKFLFISYDDNTIPRKLNSYEIAERLSFLIWGRVPPINLLEYASQNDLVQKDKMLHAINLLFDFNDGNNPNDIRRQYAWSFYHDLQNQWLEIDHLRRRNVASDINFNKGELEWATMFYIEEMFRKNKSIKEMYNSNFVVVTQNTDHLYGVDFNQASEAEYDIYHTNGHSFRKMIMPGGERKGLLTQAGVLAANAGRKTDVNPTERGLWHTSNIMCESPDGVPANIPLDDAIVGDPNLSLKEKFAEHAKSPNCASCHKIMDPIGFGLYGFDVVGKERSKDNSGFDIDPAGQLESQFFTTVNQLVDIVAESDKTESCTMSHVTTFAVGRSVDARSSCTSQKILKDVKSKNGGLRDILQKILISDLFIMRRK